MTPNPEPKPACYPSDDELVRRILSGECALFEILMRRNNGGLYRAIQSLVTDEGEVEELMQQSYVRAYTRLSQFAHGSRFSTWLIRIGINEALQRKRAQRRWQVVDGGGLESEDGPMKLPGTEAPTPEEQVGAREAIQWLERAIAELPEIYRAVLVLREVEGLSTAEAAEALEVNEETVKQRLSRARRLLRERMEAQTGECLSELFPLHASRCDRVVHGVLSRIAERPPG